MSQISFSEAERTLKKLKTRRERFLDQMELLIPWKQLEKPIRKHYAKAGNGRRPYELSIILRIHCMQLFYNLNDPAMESTLCEIESMRRFADLSIISTAISTKNQSSERDPEMHQTKKGNEWQFGMKMHIGVDESVGSIHSIEITSANEHDITVSGKLLHGEASRVWGDVGYTGIDKREEHQDRDVDWFIVRSPGKIRHLPKCHPLRAFEKTKAQERAKVEHPFLWIKKSLVTARCAIVG